MLGTLTAVLVIVAVAQWLRRRDRLRAEWLALPTTRIADAASGTRVKIVGRVEAIAAGTLRLVDGSGEAFVRLRRHDPPAPGDRVAVVGTLRLEPDPAQATYRTAPLVAVVARPTSIVVVGR